jgi:hypothetical protein
MIKMKGELVFVGLCYMPLPAFLVYINGTFGTVIDMGPGFLATDRTFHDSLPPLSFPFCPNPSGLTLFSLSSLESVT